MAFDGSKDRCNLKLTRSQHQVYQSLKEDVRVAQNSSFRTLDLFGELNSSSLELPHQSAPAQFRLEPLCPLKRSFLDLSKSTINSQCRLANQANKTAKLYSTMNNQESLFTKPLQIKSDLTSDKLQLGVPVATCEETLTMTRFDVGLLHSPKFFIHTSGDKAKLEISRLPLDLFAGTGLKFTSGEKQDLAKSVHTYALKELDRSLPVVQYTAESEEIKDLWKKYREDRPIAENWLMEE